MAAPGEEQVLSEEEVLGKIVCGSVFSSWEEIEDLKEKLRVVCHVHTRWLHTKTTQTFNKKKGVRPIDEAKFKYQSGELVCVHYGEHRDRGKGIRPNQAVLACECPWGFRVAFVSCLQKYSIQWANLEHVGHIPSEECDDAYPSLKRNLDPAAITFAERALAAGALPARIRSQLQIDFGRDVNTKFLYNLKQKLTGLHQDEWKNTAQLLYEYGKKPGNIVKVLCEDDDDQTVNLVYIQLAEQRKMFQKYGEVVQLDGSYSLNRPGMPLYTVLYEDNHGLGQPAAFFFVRAETKELIEAGLRIFANHNDVTMTKVVLLDKDASEIIAAKNIFKNAVIYLCHFHVLQAASRRLDKAKLPTDYHHEIYNYFHDCVYSDTLDELENIAAYLCNIKEDGLGDYFATCWFKKPELWAIQFRTGTLSMGNNTTNKIERFHRTIKDFLDHTKVRLFDLVKRLIDIVLQRLIDRDYKWKLARIKFKTKKPIPLLKEISTVFTHHAYKKVLAQTKFPTTSYSSLKSRNRFEIASLSGCYKISIDLSTCSCSFFEGFGLPCRHIIYLAKQEKMRLPVEKYNQRWKIAEDDLDIQLPLTNSPLTGILQATRARPITTQEIYCKAHIIARSIANMLSDLPVPEAQGHLYLFQKIADRIKNNQPIRLVEADSWPSYATGIESRAERQVEARARIPDEEMSVSDSVRAIFSPSHGNGSIRRPNSLPVQSPVITTVMVKTPTLTAVVSVTTPTDGRSPTTISVACQVMESPFQRRETAVEVHAPPTSAPLPAQPAPVDARFIGRKGPRRRGAAQVGSASTDDQAAPLPGPSTQTPSTVNPAPAPSGSATKRKLDDMTLPAAKRRAGPPRKTKQLLKYKMTPKPYKKKKDGEKNIVFLEWFVGREKAELLIKENSPAEESDLITFPENVSDGVVDSNVLKDLNKFKSLFTEDAWTCVLQTIEVKKKITSKKCPKCKRSLNSTAEFILCDSCLQSWHWKCEGIKTKPKAAVYTCTLCQSRPNI